MSNRGGGGDGGGGRGGRVSERVRGSGQIGCSEDRLEDGGGQGQGKTLREEG